MLEQVSAADASHENALSPHASMQNPVHIYITGLPSGYEVEHLIRLFFPLAPLAAEPPREGENAVLAQFGAHGLRAELRLDGKAPWNMRRLRRIMSARTTRSRRWSTVFCGGKRAFGRHGGCSQACGPFG